MAIEDAAALGIIFNKKYFSGSIDEALAVYQDVRLPRVTRVQSAAAKAAYNINERIGKSFHLTPQCIVLHTNLMFTQAFRQTKTLPLTRSRTRRRS